MAESHNKQRSSYRFERRSSNRNHLPICLSMTADFLYPTLEFANDGREVTMAIQYRPTIQATIQIIGFGPMDLKENTCLVTKDNKVINLSQPGDVSQTLRPTQSITLSCTRPSHATEINGVAYNCTKETIFNVATSGPVKAINVPRVCSETIKESRADKIEQRVQELIGQLSAVTTQVKTLRGGLRKSEEVKCGRKGNEVNCYAKCNDDERVVSGYCTVSAGGGNVQNFGLDPENNRWHCLWSGNTNEGVAIAYCAAR